MKYTKPPLSIEQKITLLKERGLRIDNEERTYKYLTHIGYFRMTGYFKFFQDHITDTFQAGTTFDQVLNVYIFDRKLRLLTLDAIEKIEVSLKATISDYMSMKYGAFWYMDRGLFKDDDPTAEAPIYQDIYDKLLSLIDSKKSKSSSLFVGAYFSKYTSEQDLPSWMLFEELTIGEISNIYKILNADDAKAIASVYKTYFGDLEKWIKVLVVIRNISAHHSRLWNRVYTSRPRVNDVIFKGIYQTQMGQHNVPEVIPNYFNVALIIHYMLTCISPNSTWVGKLESLFDEFPGIPFDAMGFEKGWRSIFT